MFTEVVDSGVSDAPTEWQLERLISIPHATTDFITVDIRNRGYVGGAHGFDERWLLVFKARDGSKVTLEQLVGKKSLSLLSTISEAELRRVRNIPSNQSLQDAGFFLPAGSSLPLENFGLFEQGLVVRFNPYEIAPYVVGATEITLPNEAISPLIASANQSGPSEVLQAVSEPAPVVTPATAEVS
jgi:hypothetical protein